MTATNHALAGMLIAVTIKQPALALPLALLSHLLLDFIPHFGDDTAKPWNKTFLTILGIDAFGTLSVLALGTLLFPHLWLLVVVCGFLGTFLDFLWILYFGFGMRGWLFTFLKELQHEFPWGWGVELVFAIYATTGLVLLARYFS